MQISQTATHHTHFKRSINELHCHSGWYQIDIGKEFHARKAGKTMVDLREVTNTLTLLLTITTQTRPGMINYKRNPKC